MFDCYPQLYLNTGLDISAVVLPHDTSVSVSLPTLSLQQFETEDPDYARVKKLGSGVSGRVVGQTVSPVPEPELESSLPKVCIID